MAVANHPHTNIIQGGVLSRGALETTANTSTAGTLTTFAVVDLALTAMAFFPMIHVSDVGMKIQGHATDQADPDKPQLQLYNDTFLSHTYDIDYRHVTA